MKNLNQILLEKIIINKNTKLHKEETSDNNRDKFLASKGASIEVDLSKQFQFMIFDPNSGILNCYECDDYSEMVNEYGYEESEAKRICNLNTGQSYTDKSGTIYTMIS